MNRFLHLIVPLLLMASACEKDPNVVALPSLDETLESTLAEHPSAKIRFEAFAFAGNHPSFERETDNFNLHLFLPLREEVYELRYYETDSLRDRDSLQRYRQKSLSHERLRNGLLMRSPRKSIRSDRWARFSYVQGDSMVVTRAIALRGASLETEQMGLIESGINGSGYFYFDWPSVPGTDQYLLILEDAKGDALFSLSTERSSFQFYDLRNMRLNFFPELRDPQLVEGASYTLHVYALTARAWISAIGKHPFIYPSQE